jgi:ATP-dependent Clp protease ATP-binding subunit ClpC
MFERYTEKARRCIFFARYEASQYGSPEVDAGHLLLGLLRENQQLHCWFPKTDSETIRRRREEEIPKHPSIATRVDLPLSAAARRVLKHGADEADRLAHKNIGTEHLFLGLLDEGEGLAAKLLREAGADAHSMREQLGQISATQSLPEPYESIRTRIFGSLSVGAVQVHNIRHAEECVREAVRAFRLCN